MRRRERLLTRARRLGTRATLVAALLLLATAGALLQPSSAASAREPLTAHGIGAVRFGVAKTVAVRELTRLFGASSARGVNTGCGSRYTEVEWHDFVAEFRLGRFTGYRYLLGGWPLSTAGSPRELVRTGVSPQLVTPAGVTLGTTLSDARRAYGRLRFVGVDRWRGTDGLLLRADERSPRRIVEIQVGTCGDF